MGTFSIFDVSLKLRTSQGGNFTPLPSFQMSLCEIMGSPFPQLSNLGSLALPCLFLLLPQACGGRQILLLSPENLRSSDALLPLLE